MARFNKLSLDFNKVIKKRLLLAVFITLFSILSSGILNHLPNTMLVQVHNIHYYPESGMIRYFDGDKIIAYLKNGKWKTLDKNVNDITDIPLKNTFVQFIQFVNEQPNSINLLPYFEKEFLAFHQIHKEKYHHESIDKTLIAFELDPESVLVPQKKLMSFFLENKVASLIITQPHISISYLEGLIPISTLENQLLNICKSQWKFKAKEFKIFSGTKTDRDYVVLELEASKRLSRIIDKIYSLTNEAKTSFPNGGFKIHVSLLSTDKGAVSSSLIEQINELMKSKKVNLSPTIKPVYATLFNKFKQAEMRKRLDV